MPPGGVDDLPGPTRCRDRDEDQVLRGAVGALVEAYSAQAEPPDARTSEAAISPAYRELPRPANTKRCGACKRGRQGREGRVRRVVRGEQAFQRGGASQDVLEQLLRAIRHVPSSNRARIPSVGAYSQVGRYVVA